MKKILGNEKGSFVIDIFLLLPLLGIIQVWLMVRYFFKYYNERSVRIKLTILTVSVFWPLAIGLYCDLYSFSFLSPLSGNEFMWSWPIKLFPVYTFPTYIDFWGFWNLLAMFFFFVIYPIVFWLWIQAGYILFGRSEKQKGGIDLVFPRKPEDEDNFN